MRYRYNRADWHRPPAQLLHNDLTLRFFGDRVEGEEVLAFQTREPLDSLTLDAQDLEVHSVRLVGADGEESLSFLVDKPERRLIVALPKPLPAETRFSVRIAATCRPTDNILDGLYLDTTPAGAPQQLMSQCQQWGFQRIMPIVDDCTAKCTWRTTLEADARYTHLISNGDVDRSANPDGVPVPVPGDPSRQRIVYVNDIPMPPYLFLATVGTWEALVDHVVTPGGRTVRLEYLVPPGRLDGAKIPMEILKDSVLWQARHVGYEYLRECYRTICMEKSNFGGMENVGNTTIVTEAALLDRWTTDRRLQYAFGVIVHEYEHNHCGSDVTMETPFDMWLNEAYTVTVEQAFVRSRFGFDAARLDEIDGLRDPLRGPLASENGPNAFPIVRDGFDSPDDVVDGITYDKAPEVLGMLRALIGPDAYDRATKAYFAKHTGGNVRTQDLLDAFAPAACGHAVPQAALDRFFHEWLFTTGYPCIRGAWSYDEAARSLAVSLSQTRNRGEGAPFTIPFRLRALASDGTVLLDERVVLDAPSASFRFSVPVRPAYLDWNSGEPFYGTFTDETATPESLALAVRTSPSGVGRVEAWRALLDRAMAELVRGAAEPAGLPVLLRLLSENLADETLPPTIRARLLTIPEEMLDPAFLPFGAARAAAARRLRAVAARALGAPALTAVYEAASAAAATDSIPHALAARTLRSAVARLLARTGDAVACARLADDFRAGECLSDMVSPVGALLEARAPGAEELLAELGRRCRDRVSAYGAYLALAGSIPDESVFDTVARIEADPAFRVEHPSHARPLYAALARNNDVLWTPRGLAWLETTIGRMARINENVAILLLGALQDHRRLPDDLPARVDALLDRLVSSIDPAASPALLSRIRAERG